MPALPKADLAHILTHTQDVWDGVRGQNLFVTGGTGFFGRWLLESFAFANDHLDLDARMTVLTRDPAAIAKRAPELAASPCIHFVRGDVRELDHARLYPQLPYGHSGGFPFLIHAAMDSVGQDDPVGVFDTIVGGTRAMLDFALAAGTRRLLFTSSGAVYGVQPSEITHVPETYPGAPDPSRASSAYGEGKRAAELLCAAYHSRHPKLEPVILCFPSMLTSPSATSSATLCAAARSPWAAMVPLTDPGCTPRISPSGSGPCFSAASPPVPTMSGRAKM